MRPLLRDRPKVREVVQNLYAIFRGSRHPLHDGYMTVKHAADLLAPLATKKNQIADQTADELAAEIERGFSEALNYTCTCGENDNTCEHCSRWEAAVGKLETALHQRKR